MMMVNVSLLIFLIVFIVHSQQFVFKHHNNEELYEILYHTTEDCPNITRLYTLSEKSLLGVPLYVIEFSSKPGHHQLRK